MRIALVNPVLAYGGAARAMVHMANHWAAAGHAVFLLSFEDATRRSLFPLHEGVELTYLALERESTTWLESVRNNLQRLGRIRAALRNVQPDVVVSFIDTGNVRVILATLLAGLPVVVSERIHPRHQPLGNGWRALRRATYPLAAAVVVQTADIADYVRRWGLRRLCVIPNPVVAPPSLGSAPHLPQPYVLAVGRLQAQKRFDLLLAAFAEVAPKHPQWALAIAGSGPLNDRLAAQAAALGLGARVHLLGQQADVGGLLARADIFVLSSAYEGFPNALCEAMAAGVASIATDCPSGPRDIVTHGEDGLLVENANQPALVAALDRLMGDAALRQRLGSRATRVTHRFSEENVMGQWDRLLGELIARTHPA